MIGNDKVLELIQAGARHVAQPSLTHGQHTINHADITALSVSFDWYGSDFLEVNASVLGLGRHNFDLWDFRKAPSWKLCSDLYFPDSGDLARLSPLRLVGRRSKITGIGLSHLTFNSAESRVRDGAAIEGRTFTSTSDASSAIATILKKSAPNERFHTLLPFRTFLDGEETLEWKDYRNPWAIIQEICELADAQCYHNGREFRLEPLTLEGSGQPFTVRQDMLIDFSFESDRAKFANAATVEFDNGVSASYEVPTGALSTQTIGRKLAYVRVPREGGRGQAISRATAVARRRAREGLSANLSLSVLPLTLRPTHIINIVDQGLTGVISSITFDVLNAQTTIQLTNIKGI